MGADIAEAGPLFAAPRERLNDAQRLAWLRLIRTENIGPATFRELVNHFGGADRALEALPGLSRSGGRRRALTPWPVERAEAELANAAQIGCRLVALGEPGYPGPLCHISAPPPLLYAMGRLELADGPSIAIVGARNGSAAGCKITRDLANGLGLAGYVVVSGLARGIDGAAHKASLNTGTIAVVAGGIDYCYPPEHQQLQQSIANSGLLLSEQPPGFRPRGQDFPRRNRIISGSCLAIIVVEAARRSGSLITARFALEQGREVFAVPGHPLDPRAEGTNTLIKNGAILVTKPIDVIQDLAPLTGGPAKVESALVEPEATPLEPISIERNVRQSVTAALGPAPIEIDEVARATEIEIRAVRIVLLELELAGRLVRHRNQLVSLAPEPER